MGKSVAVEGDVSPQPAPGFSITGTVLLTTDPKLTVGGKKVVLAATAAFADSNGNTETVSLQGSGKLQHARGGVVVDGDTGTGTTYSNKLVASASGKLQTS